MVQASDKTVLVVDDEPNVRSYLAQILEDGGFNVVTASDGDEALTRIHERRPDFISLDLVMPRKSGRRLLYELRRDKELVRIPVLIVTAHAQDELGRDDMEEIMQGTVVSGPGVYLEKPVQPKDYLRIVQEALGIEPAADIEDKVDLREQVERQLQGAEPHALRRALEILRRKAPPETDDSGEALF
jgi:CheY-like chemotaxis protein